MTDDLLRKGQRRSHQLLTRILEEPQLLSVVQELEPRVLGKLVRHIGLEDAGEIVSMATIEQLTLVFDEDLWSSESPGQDETFDADRFALWLEVMIEAGEDHVADKLSSLSEDLVTLGLSRHILVLNIDELFLEMASRNEEVTLTDKALESCLSEELDEYQIISLQQDGWDAILSVLLALDKNHRDYLERLLERLCNISTGYIEDNGGLYNVLSLAEMLESDAAADRANRRARAGYMAPSDATAFLALARATPLSEIVTSKERDVVTHAYFRELDWTDTSPTPGTSPGDGPPVRTRARVRVAQAMRDAGIIGENERSRGMSPLLEGNSSGELSTDRSLFEQVMAELHEGDASSYSRRWSELAYLANVLLAGCAFDNRRLRPVEAANAAVIFCNIGLEHLLKNSRDVDMEGENRNEASLIVEHEGADKLFRVGWHIVQNNMLDTVADYPTIGSLTIAR